MKRFIPFMKPDPLVAVLRLLGVIASGARGGLSDAMLAPLIDKAFSRGKPAAVVLGLESYDAEDLATASSPEFWRMIRQRRRGGSSL